MEVPLHVKTAKVAKFDRFDRYAKILNKAISYNILMGMIIMLFINT